MQRYGLAVVSGWYDGRCAEKEVAAEMDAITPHLQLLKDMGSTHVVYADTSLGRHGAIWEPISQRPRLGADEWPAYGRKLTELAERMADFGVRMAFHHHMGTIVETDAEVGLLMRHTGEAVGLLYDTGHSALLGRRSAGAGQGACEARRPRPLQGRAQGRCWSGRAPRT